MPTLDSEVYRVLSDSGPRGVRSISLELSLQRSRKWCRIGASEVHAQMLLRLNSLLRFARRAIRGGASIATVMGRVVFASIVLLVVLLGVLSAETRMPGRVGSGTSQHLSKVSRMVECGGDKLALPQIEISHDALSVSGSRVFVRFPPLELPIHELGNTLPAHGLRAPPLS